MTGGTGSAPESKGVGFKRTWFPIIRCFWHMANPDTDKEQTGLNVTVDGNFFESGADWIQVSKKYIK
jgi:hypothetical protein